MFSSSLGDLWQSSSLMNKIQEWSLRLRYQVTQLSEVLRNKYKKSSIHQRNMKVLMIEIYKSINYMFLPLMKSLLLFRNNAYENLRSLLLSTDTRNKVNYRLEKVTYRGPNVFGKTIIWIQIFTSRWRVKNWNVEMWYMSQQIMHKFLTDLQISYLFISYLFIYLYFVYSWLAYNVNYQN